MSQSLLRESYVFENRFVILCLLGSGGMGAVYKAQQSDAERIVALKILHPALAQSDEFRKRFRRECMALSKLANEHIITFYHAAISSEGQPYAVFEYLEGRTLRDLISASAPHLQSLPVSEKTKAPALPLMQCLRILEQIAGAMNAAHKVDIVHRDLKPENIIIQEAPEKDWVKVLDFGLSKESLTDERESQRLTLTGDLVGTASYMSPEQCEGRAADARSDIYSLGCIAFECLAGKKLFDADAAVSVLHMHATKNATSSLNELSEISPPALLKLLAAMLEKNPEARPQNMETVILELRAARREVESGVVKSDKLQDESNGLKKKKSMMSYVLVLLVFGVLAASACLVIFEQQKNDTVLVVEKNGSQMTQALAKRNNTPRVYALLEEAKTELQANNLRRCIELSKQSLAMTDLSRELMPARFRSLSFLIQSLTSSQLGDPLPYLKMMEELLSSPAFEQASERKKIKWRTDYFLTSSQIYTSLGQNDKVIKAAEDYEALYKRMDDRVPANLLYFLLSKGHALRASGRFPEALSADSQALDISTGLGKAFSYHRESIYPSLIYDYVSLQKSPSELLKLQNEYVGLFSERYPNVRNKEILLTNMMQIIDTLLANPRYAAGTDPLVKAAWTAAKSTDSKVVSTQLRLRALQKYLELKEKPSGSKLPRKELVELGKNFLQILDEQVPSRSIPAYENVKNELASELCEELTQVNESALGEKIKRASRSRLHASRFND